MRSPIKTKIWEKRGKHLAHFNNSSQGFTYLVHSCGFFGAEVVFCFQKRLESVVRREEEDSVLYPTPVEKCFSTWPCGFPLQQHVCVYTNTLLVGVGCYWFEKDTRNTWAGIPLRETDVAIIRLQFSQLDRRTYTDGLPRDKAVTSGLNFIREKPEKQKKKKKKIITMSNKIWKDFIILKKNLFR